MIYVFLLNGLGMIKISYIRYLTLVKLDHWGKEISKIQKLH